MFCEKCGNQIKEDDNFCSVCGNILNPTIDSNINRIKRSSSNSVSKVIGSIGTALMLIGTIAGFGSITYIINSEMANTDMTDAGWKYHYNGGKELAIGIAVFALSSLIIGICMKVSSKK